MNEHTLKSLLQLFAIIANLKTDKSGVLEKNYVESFLKKQFSGKTIATYLDLFISYYNKYRLKVDENKNNAEYIEGLLNNIISTINNELPLKQKFIVCIYLLQFIIHSESSYISNQKENTLTIVENIAKKLLLNPIEFESCKWFIFNAIHKIPEKKILLIIENNPAKLTSGIKQLSKSKLKGQLFVLQIKSANVYIARYKGEETIELNNKRIFAQHIYILNNASIISLSRYSQIYFSEIVGAFFDESKEGKINLNVNEIEFYFPKSENGIHRLSFNGKSGQMVGIMGGSGVGKSTLLNLLNGNIPLKQGEIKVNGYDIHENKNELEGIIGFIPQDDLLIEELTVYQNLHFNARLCFGNLEDDEIESVVNNLLVDLDLFEIKELKVGSPINKFISGGQRKRLNIALELIREPFVLFVDEPTSGLSSNDSLNVMNLLKEQALKGKFLMVNIHQPSSEIFKMFDNLLILDKGGYPVYYGNPIESVTYFKKMTNKVDSLEGECSRCGNINPEEILEIIEEKDVNEYGEFTSNRKLEPIQWYEYFHKKIQYKVYTKNDEITPLPDNKFKIPSIFKQFVIFSTRNLLSKIKDQQYIITAFIIPPILAVILGVFTKYVIGTDNNPFEYIFSKNENLPGYLFMTVVVSLFLGLIISAEEIIHDRKIIERERFLNLSRVSYLNSKIIFLFVLSAIQMLVFVYIGNSILEIKGMTWSFWLILFSTSCFANMMGLVISSGLKSVIAIYILVPFLLVPQLLLSGTIVKFDKLHFTLTSQEYVPLVGDIMASRWAYEALLVYQFKNNAYNKNYFYINQQENNISYKLRNLIPELENRIEDCNLAFSKNMYNKKVEHNYNVIKNELFKLNFNRELAVFNELNKKNYTLETSKKLATFLDKQKQFLQKELNKAIKENDIITTNLLTKLKSSENLIKLKQMHYNGSIADLVLNNNEFRIMYITNNKIIQKSYPIYKIPESKFGRAHFLSPVKILGNKQVDTFSFNAIVIWLMTFILYIILISNSFEKVLNLFNKIG